jgi:two-component system response regulator RegA
MQVHVSIPQQTVLVIDDESTFRERLCRALRARGFLALEAWDRSSCITALIDLEPCLILLDLRLGGDNGLSLLPLLRERAADARIVVLTGYGSIATALTAMKQGADHYLTKPVDADDIVQTYESLRAPESEQTLPTNPTAPSLARVEWEHIQRVLAACDGNISHAARVLGLHRRSLQRKLFKYPPPH